MIRSIRKLNRRVGVIDRLQVESLEDRLVPAQWPIFPVNQQGSLLTTYGQYVEAGSIHFHEGTDVLAPAGAFVRAVEAGEVVGVLRDPTNYYSYISVTTTGTEGWNYIHVLAGSKPAANLPNQGVERPWQIGDKVAVGDILGILAPVPPAFGFPSHVHLDRGDGQDSFYATVQDPAMRNIRRPVDDPLRYLVPAVDGSKPVVEDLHFRIAANDRAGVLLPNAGFPPREVERGDNQYFTSVTQQNYLLVGSQSKTSTAAGPAGLGGSGQIDVIASIYDKFGAVNDPALRRLGVRSVWFNFTGQAFGSTTGDVHPFYFSREFMNAPANQAGAFAGQNYDSLRRLDMTRVVYENDQFSNSADWSAYWYTVTNTDGDVIVELDDRDRSWNSLVRTGGLWNDVGPAAARNADAQFPDDIYNVDVWAFDAQSNMSDTRRKPVLLDNWVQNLTTTAGAYTTNQRVIVNGGDQYRANQTVWVYAVKAAAPAEGVNLLVAERKAQATANANGTLTNTDLGLFEEGAYWLVADYNGDGKYQPQLDGIQTVTINKAMAMLDLRSNRNPSFLGQAVTFTATVTSVPVGGPRPVTGVVEFFVGGPPIAVALNAAGQATYTISTLSVGSHTITAHYLGNSYYFDAWGSLVQQVSGSGGSGGSIGDYVWNDADRDGVQDAGESGRSGVTVNLLNASGGVAASTTTGGNGFYSFSGLGAGTYEVQFVAPAGMTFSPRDATTDALDSDASSNGRTGTFVLAANERRTDIDAGLYSGSGGSGGSIGDWVWSDTDRDGAQDAGESGFAGATVNLRNASGVLLASTTSDASGYHSFAGLGAGTYQVEFIPPAGYSLSTPATRTVTLGAGQTFLDADAGVYGSSGSGGSGGTIGDFVWYDTDRDGVQDAGEYGFSGATVQLRDGAGNLLSTTTSGSSGYYSFAGLGAGTYQVQFVVPSGYSFTTASTRSVTLAAGESRLDIDAGVFGSGGSGGLAGVAFWRDPESDPTAAAGATAWGEPSGAAKRSAAPVAPADFAPPPAEGDESPEPRWSGVYVGDTAWLGLDEPLRV